MQIIPTLMVASFLTIVTGLTTVTGLTPANAGEIGKYTVELDGKPMEFISAYDATANRSDLGMMQADGTKMITVDGYAGSTDGHPDLPILSMTISGTMSGVYTKMMFIQLLDENFKTALTSDDWTGQRHIENITVDDVGNISFDFSADLVRLNVEEGTPVAGASGAHIEGRYSGKIPASEISSQ